MDNLDDVFVKISALRYLELLEKEDLIDTLQKLGVCEWDGYYQEAYYRKTATELMCMVLEKLL